MEFEYIPSTPSSPVLWGAALQTTFKVASLLHPSLIHRKSNKTTSVLYLQPCQLCFSWFISCQMCAENRTPNQIPGPQSLCSPGQQAPCWYKIPPEPWLSCSSLDGGSVPHSCVVPAPVVTQPFHSRAGLVSSSSWTRFTSWMWRNLSRCLPTTGACGRKGLGRCRLCGWGIEVTVEGRGWCHRQQRTLRSQRFRFWCQKSASHAQQLNSWGRKRPSTRRYRERAEQTDSGEESHHGRNEWHRGCVPFLQLLA